MHLLNIQVKKEDRITPEMLLPLPSDPPPAPPEILSEEDYQRILLLDSDLIIVS